MASIILFIRKWHRDLGYFFVGLTLSFSLSGIALNHRRIWSPETYVYVSKNFKTQLHLIKRDSITDELVQGILAKEEISVKYMGFRIESPVKMNIFLEGGTAVVNLKDGTVILELSRETPLIGQMVDLHTSQHRFWIWYSDIFSLGLIIISITGIFMLRGKNGFGRWGFKLTIAGILFPLLMLLFADL
jgi:uncharacterized protein